jgi:hypothetical protein
MFNATFNNISAISWRTVLVVEEAGVQRTSGPLLLLRPQHYRFYRELLGPFFS